MPAFYERLTRELESCDGPGLAYCLDERIDENNQRLSMSGQVSDTTKVFGVDEFIAIKAEIANQAFSGSLLKTNGQPAPVQFRLDMLILADVAFWADWGRHCRQIVQVNLPLCQYRWHGDNTTNVVMPGIHYPVKSFLLPKPIFSRYDGKSELLCRRLSCHVLNYLYLDFIKIS